MEAARPADGHTHKMFMCKTAAADEISSSASSRILQVSKMSLPPGSLPFQTSQMLYPVFHAPMEETTVRSENFNIGDICCTCALVDGKPEV
ncbi:uncharacterized protein LOC144244802 isoform X2 [Crocuta crocuta]